MFNNLREISEEKTRILNQLTKGNISQESYDRQMDHLDYSETLLK